MFDSFFAVFYNVRMLYDNHMHTKYSGDSEADPVSMIESAMEKGLSGITFTDHLDWDYVYEPHLFDLDIDSYYKTMRSLQEEYTTEDFSISVGIELGLQPHLADRHHDLLDEYDFDHVIGSIHQIDGTDPYYYEYWENKDIQKTYDDYFRCTYENLCAFDRIDTMGHLDYISRYGMRYASEHCLNGALLLEEHKDTVLPILEFLIEHDIALEVNTGSFRYGYSEPNPSYDIVRQYLDMGGKKLTLGADAHKPEDVGIGFASLPDFIMPYLYNPQKKI